MTKKPEYLRQAADLVQQFRVRLDVSAPQCSGCGRPHAVDLRDFRADQELEAVFTKLMRFARAYEEGAT